MLEETVRPLHLQLQLRPTTPCAWVTTLKDGKRDASTRKAVVTRVAWMITLVGAAAPPRTTHAESAQAANVATLWSNTARARILKAGPKAALPLKDANTTPAWELTLVGAAARTPLILVASAEAASVALALPP